MNKRKLTSCVIGVLSFSLYCFILDRTMQAVSAGRIDNLDGVLINIALSTAWFALLAYWLIND